MATATPDVTAPIPDDLAIAAINNAVARQNSLGLVDAEPEPSPVPEEATPPEAAGEEEPDTAGVDSEEDTDDDDGEATPAVPEAVAPDTDPFESLTKAGQPLTYTVNGQQKQYEGIVEVAGKGAVIPQAHLNRVKDTIQRAEHAVEQNRKLYEETQRYAALGGMERIQTVERDYAKLNAASQVFADLVADPAKMAALFFVQPDGSLALNHDRYDILIHRMRLEAERAEMDVTKQLSEKVQTYQRQASEPTEREATLNAAIQQLADGLPPEDVAKAQAVFREFGDALFRKATPEDVAKWPNRFNVGDTILDVPRMQGWFADRREMRSAMTKEAEARAKAAAENAKRQPVAKVATPPKPQKPKAVPRNEDGTFAERPKLSRGEALERALAGKPIFGDSDE